MPGLSTTSSAKPTNGHFDMTEFTNGAVSVSDEGDSDSEESVAITWLELVAPSHHQDVLSSLNALRKNHQFCDVTLLVGNQEISAHKGILASCSPFLFDMLTKGDAAINNLFRLRDFDYRSFQHLVNFMYTGRLYIPHDEVKGVYETARKLKMDTAVKACSDYLAANLSCSNCLEVRSSAKEIDTKHQVDHFIQSNIKEVTNITEFTTLPRLQVKIIGADGTLMSSGAEKNLFDLVVYWAKSQMTGLKAARLDALLNQVNVLYLSSDNTLQDCENVDTVIDEEGFVQDYKKLKRRQSSTGKGKVITKEVPQEKETPESQGHLPYHKFNIMPSDPLESEWSIIAYTHTGKHTYIALAVLGDQMTAISMQVRVAQGSPYSSGSEDTADSPVFAPHDVPRFSGVADRYASLTPLAAMHSPRCGYGLETINGQMVALGGYDRGECLNSVETYDLTTNQWTKLRDMHVARARCAAAVVKGMLYALGGSDGLKENKSVERYNSSTGKWEYVANMLQERQWPGVAVMNDKIYCIGGLQGQKVLGDCEVYDPDTNTWTPIAPLKKARYQCAVCHFNGRLYAVGGTGNWNCLNSVEVYNPTTNTWEMTLSLNGVRRGAGVGVIDDKLYILGGNDGAKSLDTTEVIDFESDCWCPGPRLSIARANISATILHGRLFTVGGFTGKKFLNTIEYLDVEENEWCCFLPVEMALAPPHCQPLSTSDFVRESACQIEHSAESDSMVVSLPVKAC